MKKAMDDVVTKLSTMMGELHTVEEEAKEKRGR